MRKFLPIVLILFQAVRLPAQDTDTLKTQEKKVHWLVGVDGISALNLVSVVSGVEAKRSRYSISLSHMFGSSRFGVYYDFCIHKEYKFFVGLGYHNSFRFSDFNVSKAEYRDSLITNHIEESASTISFFPDYGETRLQYFYSFSISKEFKLYKGLHFNFKVMAVYGYNPYYENGEFWPNGGIQFHYKW